MQLWLVFFALIFFVLGVAATMGSSWQDMLMTGLLSALIGSVFFVFIIFPALLWGASSKLRLGKVFGRTVLILSMSFVFVAGLLREELYGLRLPIYLVVSGAVITVTSFLVSYLFEGLDSEITS